MSLSSLARRPTVRAFLPYAAISLVLVVVLGAVLALGYRAEARSRGLAHGKAEATLVAQTAVEPLLSPMPLSDTLPPGERADLQRLAARAVGDGSVLRLRVRNLAGRVLYSDDGSGFASAPEDEALDAAKGEVVAKLTRVNGDSNDTGAVGVPAVEVYQPLLAGSPPRRVGVLELYLPYAPIQHDIGSGMHALYWQLGLGLLGLYLVLLVITASVTRRLRREVARTAFLAGHDPLTQLPNRILFHDKGKAVLSRTERRHRRATVAIVDLDRFKAVNDTLGHHNGDRLLVQIGERLRAEARDGDTVARLGGDEFGVVLVDSRDPHAALSRLRRVIEAELEVSGLPLSVEASIGYAVAPEDGIDMDQLMQKADVALYHAKDRHLGVARYDASQNHYDAASLGLIAELRHAISEDQLVLHYQPKTRLSDGTVEAVEALVRWQHPVHGLVYPDRFVPLVEQTDLIDDLTSWVMKRALADLKRLPGSDVAVAVNVSARNLVRTGFASEVKAAVEAAGIEPGRLIVELTETSLLVDPHRARDTLAELVAAGVQASVDDFGQGQTSLGYLSALPLSEIKIDKSFVMDVLTNPAHAAIVRSVVELGHNLGLEVVAEGVESDDIRGHLQDVGCDVAQGYFFARPMPLVELHAWLSLSTNQLSEVSLWP